MSVSKTGSERHWMGGIKGSAHLLEKAWLLLPIHGGTQLTFHVWFFLFLFFFPENSTSTLLMTLLFFLSCWHWAPLITSGHLMLLMWPWSCISTGTPKSGLCACLTVERWDPMGSPSCKSWACGFTMLQKRALTVILSLCLAGASGERL